MKVIYLTSWYHEKNEERHFELKKCIGNVLTSKDVDKTVFICDNSCAPPFATNETTYILASERPTFKYFCEIANMYAEKGDVVIIANTDIYPEAGTRALISDIKQNECYALARWDEDVNGNKVLLDRWDTGDAWVFRAPINVPDANFYMGWCGCDNAFAERLQAVGYCVKNPSKTIKFNHLHNSGIRNYNHNDRVPKPYLLITPHELGDSSVNYNHIL